MKRILGVLLVLSFITSGVYAATLKPALGFGSLLSPSLPEVSAGNQTKGGMNYGIALLFGEKINYGVEIDSMKLWEYSYTNGIGQVSASINTIPILGVIELPISEGTGFNPYFQGGLGTFMSTGKAAVSVMGISFESSTSSSDFGGFIGLGGKISMGTSTDLDLSVKYYFISMTESTSLLNIGAGLRFKL
ncbi:MAG: hypothetical protein A3J83_08845 [Elusimicrobia bacterium RIFOXYA2_FULL_40_6]|nr:MAG: hypothetical protein A3J83_08845 [Elusimicrobia bacterium RIFOXYA2_FULL_40_6]